MATAFASKAAVRVFDLPLQFFFHRPRTKRDAEFRLIHELTPARAAFTFAHPTVYPAFAVGGVLFPAVRADNIGSVLGVKCVIH